MNLLPASVKIGLKLPLIMISLTTAGIIGAAYIANQSAASTLRQEGQARLAGVAELQAKAIDGYLHRLEMDLKAKVGNPQTLTALEAFAAALAGPDDPEVTPKGGDANPGSSGAAVYAQAHEEFHGYFRNIQQAFGYDDVVLLDTAGQVLYTVTGDIDAGTDVRAGAWKGSGLAQAYQGVQALGPDAESVLLSSSRPMRRMAGCRHRSSRVPSLLPPAHRSAFSPTGSRSTA